MTLTILFWNYNIRKGALMRGEPTVEAKANVIARVARHHKVDVLVLCECEIARHIMLSALQALDPQYEQPPNLHNRFYFFTRFPATELEFLHSDGRLDIRQFHRVGFMRFSLAAFHYIDSWNNTPARQHDQLRSYKQTIDEAEEKAGHTHTVLFGDLNMNPFAIGMLEPRRGLGAMMTRELAESHSDVARGGTPRFYNPMWSVMGRPDAPGTYYWDQNEPENPYWNCIDGVLLRPSLRGVFVEESLQILTTIPGPAGEEVRLYHWAEKHCRIDYSDHLPIMFRLDVPQAKDSDHA